MTLKQYYIEEVSKQLPDGYRYCPVSTQDGYYDEYSIDPATLSLVERDPELPCALNTESGYTPRDWWRIYLHPADAKLYPFFYMIRTGSTPVKFYVVEHPETSTLFITDSLSIFHEREEYGIFNAARASRSWLWKGAFKSVFVVITDKAHSWAYNQLRRVVLEIVGANEYTADYIPVKSPQFYTIVGRSRGWIGVIVANGDNSIEIAHSSTHFVYHPTLIKSFSLEENPDVINDIWEYLSTAEARVIQKDPRNILLHYTNLSGKPEGYFMIGVRNNLFYDYHLPIEDTEDILDIFRKMSYLIDRKARIDLLNRNQRSIAATKVRSILQKHQNEYISFQDSIEAGNCEFGTREFQKQYFPRNKERVKVKTILKHPQIKKILNNPSFQRVVLWKWG